MTEMKLTVQEVIELYEFVKKFYLSDKDFYREQNYVNISRDYDLMVEIPLMQHDTLGMYKTVIFGDTIDPFGETL